MFNDYYLTTTVLLIFQFFITACGTFGLGVISTLTNQKINLKNGKTDDNHSIIISQLIIALIGLLSCFIGVIQDAQHSTL